MFYDRKRIELFSSTTEVSYKLDGDRHSRGQFIPDSNVHHMVLVIVITTFYINIYMCIHAGKRVGTWIFIHCEVCELRSPIHCSHVSFPVLLWERVHSTLHTREVLISLPTYDLMHLLRLSMYYVHVYIHVHV